MRWRYSVSAYAKYDTQKYDSTIVLEAAQIIPISKCSRLFSMFNKRRKWKFKQKLLFDCSYCYIFLYISLLLYNYRSFQFWIDWPKADCVECRNVWIRARPIKYCVMKLWFVIFLFWFIFHLCVKKCAEWRIIMIGQRFYWSIWGKLKAKTVFPNNFRKWRDC